MGDYEDLRRELRGLPWAAVELLVANVVVGTMTRRYAAEVGRALRARLTAQAECADGDGI